MPTDDRSGVDTDAEAAMRHEAARPLPFGLRKFYAIPDSLDELHGPTDGMFDVPLSIHWARPGGSTVDLASKGGALHRLQCRARRGEHRAGVLDHQPGPPDLAVGKYPEITPDDGTVGESLR